MMHDNVSCDFACCQLGRMSQRHVRQRPNDVQYDIFSQSNFTSRRLVILRIANSCSRDGTKPPPDFLHFNREEGGRCPELPSMPLLFAFGGGCVVIRLLAVIKTMRTRF